MTREASYNINMAPYSKKVKIVYDGKVFVPEAPLDLPSGREFEIIIESSRPKPTPPADLRSVEERLAALDAISGFDNGIILTNEAFRRDVNMYPDRS